MALTHGPVRARGRSARLEGSGRRSANGGTFRIDFYLDLSPTRRSAQANRSAPDSPRVVQRLVVALQFVVASVRSVIPRRNSPIVTTLINNVSCACRLSQAATLASGRGRNISEGMLVSSRNPLMIGQWDGQRRDCGCNQVRRPQTTREQARRVPQGHLSLPGRRV